MLRIQLISNRFLCRYKLNICRYWDKPSTTQPHTTNDADVDDYHGGFDEYERGGFDDDDDDDDDDEKDDDG